jgi:DNA-directed RNA polymerase specialized sigma subunit
MIDSPTTTTEYDSCSNEEINDLISRYREGDEDAASILLKKFRPLIYNYYKLLSSGTYDSEIIERFLKAISKQSPYKMASIISFVLRNIPREDLWQECVLGFLETIYKYDYVVGRYDLSMRKRVTNLLSQENATVEYPNDRSYYVSQYKNHVHFMRQPRDVELDDDWVEGTTSDLTSELSPQERLVSRMIWIEYQTVEDVCLLLNLTRGEVNKIKDTIKEKLSKSLGIKY